MLFSKDEWGGKTEKDGSESAKNTGFTENISAMEMQEFVQKISWWKKWKYLHSLQSREAPKLERWM